jgi:hypothetical protein
LPNPEYLEARRHWIEARSKVAALVNIAPLSAAALRDAIEQPAARAGHLFEPGLVDRLLQDAGDGPGAIAQLQRALNDIWSERRRGWLTNKAYDQRGGIVGRYQHRLEMFLQTLGESARRATQTLLENLVKFDTQLRLATCAVQWERLASIPVLAQEGAESLRDRLVAARLIDFWRDAAAGSEVLWCALGQPTPAPQIETWARANVEFLLWRQRFATYLASTTGVPVSIAGEELTAAEHWLDTHGDQMFAVERELIDRSITAREQHEEHIHRRRKRQTRWLFGLSAGSVVVAVTLCFAAYSYARNVQLLSRQLEAKVQLRNLVNSSNLPADLFNQVVDVSQTLGGSETEAVPRIYIHIANEQQRTTAAALRIRLQRLSVGGHTGALFPGIELVASAPVSSELRCFKETDCGTIARELLDAINFQLTTPALSLENLSQTYAMSPDIKPGQYEIWFAAGDLELLPDFRVDIFRCESSEAAAGSATDAVIPALRRLGVLDLHMRRLAVERRGKVRPPPVGLELRYSGEDSREVLAARRVLSQPEFAAAGWRGIPVRQPSPGYLSLFACPDGQ